MQLFTLFLKLPIILFLAIITISQCLIIKTKANIIQHLSSLHAFYTCDIPILAKTEISSLLSFLFIFSQIVVIADSCEFVVGACCFEAHGFDSAVDYNNLYALQVIAFCNNELFVSFKFFMNAPFFKIWGFEKFWLDLKIFVSVFDIWQTKRFPMQSCLFVFFKAKRNSIQIFVWFYFWYISAIKLSSVHERIDVIIF